MKNFHLEDGYKLPSAKVSDITLTIGVGGDVLIIEQPGDNIEPDLIMIYGKKDGEKLLELLEEWLRIDPDE